MNEEQTRVRRFVVFVDTNAIFTKEEDSVELMVPGFRQRWDHLSAEGDVELRIPDLVVRELAYQREKHFVKLAQEAHAGLERVKKALALGSPDAAKIERLAIRTAILAKLRAQLKEVPFCSEVEVPYQALSANMIGIVAASVWRQPPFKEKGESGFRDAVILETVKHAVAVEPHSDIAFITKDERLTAAVLESFKGASNFGHFGSLAEYENFLNLARRRFPPEFLHAVTGKASDIFEFQVWPELDLAAKIVERYGLRPGATAFDNTPAEGALAPPIFLGMGLRHCTGNPEWYFMNTKLLSVVGQDDFHWRSTIIAATPYAGPPPTLLSGALEQTPLYLRVMELTIEWAATVNAEQEFSRFRLIAERKETEGFIDAEQRDAVLAPTAPSA